MISTGSPTLMARDMVAIYSDIGFIRAYILREFGRAPSRAKIEDLRREYLEAQERSRSRETGFMSCDKVLAARRAQNKRYRQRKAQCEPA